MPASAICENFHKRLDALQKTIFSRFLYWALHRFSWRRVGVRLRPARTGKLVLSSRQSWPRFAFVGVIANGGRSTARDVSLMARARFNTGGLINAYNVQLLQFDRKAGLTDVYVFTYPLNDRPSTSPANSRQHMTFSVHLKIGGRTKTVQPLQNSFGKGMGLLANYLRRAFTCAGSCVGGWQAVPVQR